GMNEPIGENHPRLIPSWILYNDVFHGGDPELSRNRRSNVGLLHQGLEALFPCVELPNILKPTKDVFSRAHNPNPLHHAESDAQFDVTPASPLVGPWLLRECNQHVARQHVAEIILSKFVP